MDLKVSLNEEFFYHAMIPMYRIEKGHVQFITSLLESWVVYTPYLLAHENVGVNLTELVGIFML